MSMDVVHTTRAFDGTGTVTVKNVKLFPGTDNDTTPEQIKGQFMRVISEIENDVLEVVEWGDDD